MSINQLMELTRKSFRTIKTKLASLQPVRIDGRSNYYDSSDALPLIYDIKASDRKLNEAELRVETAKAVKMEIEIARLRNELVPIEDVATVVEKEYSAVRAAMLSLPSKVSQELVALDDVIKIKHLLEDSVNEVLQELSADQQFALGEVPSTVEEDDESRIEGTPGSEPAEDSQAEASHNIG